MNWPALDGLRGLSILSVILVHLWAHSTSTGNGLPLSLTVGHTVVNITWIFATGHNAVVTFFVLSGFLLYRHWLENPGMKAFGEHAADFYRRRARRILPAFVFFTVVYLVLVMILGKHHFGADTSFGNLVFNLTFTSPIAAALGSGVVGSLDIVPGTWSLNAEVWFYVLMPALALGIGRLPAKWLILLVLSLCSPFYRELIGPNASFITRYSLPGVADAFLIGMAIAALSVAGHLRKGAAWLFPLGALWYVTLCASIYAFTFDPAYQLALASGLMVAGLVAPGESIWQRCLSGPVLVRIGHVSYSMFLCNIVVAWYFVLPLTELFGFESPAARFAMNLLVGYPVIYLISSGTYKFVETRYFKGQSERLRVKSPVVGIALAVIAFSVVLASAAYVHLDGQSVEYSGHVSRITNALMSLSRLGSKPRAIEWKGQPVLDSDSKHAPVTVAQAAESGLHISSSGITTGDRWVSVTLPVAAYAVARGRTAYMKGTISVTQGSDAKLCLDIFNGQQDYCTNRVSLSGTREVTVEAPIGSGDPIQFKVSIFPGKDQKPFDVRVENLRIFQEG